jgi:NDP-sugar pyrophosphorylase family protein
VLNGDLLTDMDFTGLLDWHRGQGAAATVAAARRQEQLEYGALEIAGDQSLLNIREKPRTEWLVSMGLYALRRDALREHIPPMQPLDMPDLLLRLKAEGERVMVLPTEAMWIDIGRPDDYARAQAMADVERKAAGSAAAAQGRLVP